MIFQICPISTSYGPIVFERPPTWILSRLWPSDVVHKPGISPSRPGAIGLISSPSRSMATLMKLNTCAHHMPVLQLIRGPLQALLHWLHCCPTILHGQSSFQNEATLAQAVICIHVLCILILWHCRSDEIQSSALEVKSVCNIRS